MAIGEFLLAIGKVAASSLSEEAKAILLNLSFLEGLGSTPDTSELEPMLGPPGFYCRPKPPVTKDQATGIDPEGHAEVVGVRMGDQVVPLGFRDLRLNAQLNPKVGEVGLIGYGGGFICIKDNDDGNGSSIALYAMRKKSDGSPDKQSAVSIDTTAANAHVSIVHEAGQSFTMTKDGHIVMANAAGDASIILKDDGQILLNGTAIVLNGSVHMGSSDPTLGVPIIIGASAPGAPSAMITAGS